MAAGPVGSVWRAGTWTDTGWTANTWANAVTPPPVTDQPSTFHYGYRMGHIVLAIGIALLTLACARS